MPVILQGSIVEVGQAEWTLGGYDDPASCDAVEMTRGDRRSRSRCETDAGRGRPHPAVYVLQPDLSGARRPESDRHVHRRADQWPRDRGPRLVRTRDAARCGGGRRRPCRTRGRTVAAVAGTGLVVERDDRVGGMARIAGPNSALVDWWQREHAHLGTDIATGTDSWTPTIAPLSSRRPVRFLALARTRWLTVRRRSTSLTSAEASARLPDEGMIVLFDPIGGPIAVSLAEELGPRVVLITQDNIAGNELARTGDLAPANTRLAQQGVTIERRKILLRSVRLIGIGALEVEVEDRYSGQRRTIPCTAVVDCGFRVPTDAIDAAVQIGDTYESPGRSSRRCSRVVEQGWRCSADRPNWSRRLRRRGRRRDDDQLSADTTRLQLTHGVGHLGEREGSLDHWRHLATFDQFPETLQARVVLLRHEHRDAGRRRATTSLPAAGDSFPATCPCPRHRPPRACHGRSASSAAWPE